MADVKILTIDNLDYFKDKQDAYNDGKFATKASVPTKVSQLENDSAYQTKTQIDTAVQSAINTALASVMTYKGAKATAEELPSEGNKLGDVWHVTADTAEYAWDGTKWEVLGSTMNVSVSWSDITGKPETFTPSSHTHDVATGSIDGFMSSEDKTKLDGIADGANNYVHPTSTAGAKANGLYKIATDIDGHVTDATVVIKADIDALGVISVPDGGTEGQFVQNKSGNPEWSDGMYLSDGKIKSGATDVSSVSVNNDGSKVEVAAGSDSSIQITSSGGKVLPIGITGEKSAVGLGGSPIDAIYAEDISNVSSADGKRVPNINTMKSYVSSNAAPPLPTGGATGQFLQKTADGQDWANVPEYADATQSESGLMSATDKIKLDSFVVAQSTDVDELF